MKFTLAIDCSKQSMRTYEEVALALRATALRLERNYARGEEVFPGEEGVVKNHTSLKVGGWEVVQA